MYNEWCFRSVFSVLLVIFSSLRTLLSPTFLLLYMPISGVFSKSKVWKTNVETGGFHNPPPIIKLLLHCSIAARNFKGLGIVLLFFFIVKSAKVKIKLGLVPSEPDKHLWLFYQRFDPRHYPPPQSNSHQLYEHQLQNCLHEERKKKSLLYYKELIFCKCNNLFNEFQCQRNHTYHLRAVCRIVHHLDLWQ